MQRYQKVIQDAFGNVVSGADVRVRHSDTGALATVYEDAEGNTVKPQPIKTDASGRFWLYAPGGTYDIHAEFGTFEVELPDVRIGTASGYDVGTAEGTVPVRGVDGVIPGKAETAGHADTAGKAETAGHADTAGNAEQVGGVTPGTVVGYDVGTGADEVPTNAALEAQRLVANVEDFGAVGGQDSTAAFNAALAAANYVFIPPTAEPFILQGRDVVVPSNTTLFGVGEASQVKLKDGDYGDTDGSNEAYAIGVKGGQDIVLRDFSVDGNKDNVTGTNLFNIECIDIDDAVRVYCHRIVLRNAPSDGIDFDRSEDCYAEHCHAFDCGGYGVHISLNSKDCEVSHCTATRCGIERERAGFDVHSSAEHCRLSNLKAIECYEGIQLAGANNKLSDFRIASSVRTGLRISGQSNSVVNGRSSANGFGTGGGNGVTVSNDRNSLVGVVADSNFSGGIYIQTGTGNAVVACRGAGNGNVDYLNQATGTVTAANHFG